MVARELWHIQISNGTTFKLAAIVDKKVESVTGYLYLPQYTCGWKALCDVATTSVHEIEWLLLHDC